MKRRHYAPSAKCLHECLCFYFSAPSAFWLAVFAGNGLTFCHHWSWPGKVGLLAVRTACQMYFPSNCETNDEW